LSGKPLSKDYAELRMRWEPLYEVTQMKGDSETHPALSPTDEFADYGTWDKGSFGPEPKTPDMLPREYARSALERGMAYGEKLGANPFKFGMVGSTDTHTSLATTEENNFFGKAPPGEPGTPGRLSETITGYFQQPEGPDITIRHFATLSSGLAGVWARENTRESLWDAMKRKEVFGSTGTRLQVRVFAGWDFSQADVDSPDFAAIGYKKGVPMGADLNGSGKAPRLLVQALREPDGANLDRIQIVKGWVDASGKTQERVFDVACSDGRTILNARCNKAVGNTVNVAMATFSNSIGDAMLSAYWEDPAFDPARPAFYYVRVLEIPTPTWTTYDAAVYGTGLPEGPPVTHQERAYTSPIWFTPE
jgi:uncharacterized protein DUF3604